MRLSCVLDLGESVLVLLREELKGEQMVLLKAQSVSWNCNGPVVSDLGVGDDSRVWDGEDTWERPVSLEACYTFGVVGS